MGAFPETACLLVFVFVRTAGGTNIGMMVFGVVVVVGGGEVRSDVGGAGLTAGCVRAGLSPELPCDKAVPARCGHDQPPLLDRE